MSVSLGIDFGTSATKAAIHMNGRMHLVVDEARAHISSAVHVPRRGGLVPVPNGDGWTDPVRTITSIKRLLGRAYSDPKVRELDNSVSYKIVRSKDGWAHVSVDDDEISPVQVVTTVMARVRELAERMAGQKVERAVLSIPVHTCPGYGSALMRAAELAGLRQVRLVHEPVAALWGSRIKGGDYKRRVLVSDFGAGTYDCALLEMRPERVEVLACGGDEYLGGDDFDLALADGIAGSVFSSARADLRRDLVKWGEMVRACEKAKCRLSNAPVTPLRLEKAFVKEGVRHDVQVTLERSNVERAWVPLVDRALTANNEVLSASRSPAALIDDLVLVGGSNLVPLVRSAFVKRIGRQPTAITASDVVIAVGLATMAATHPQ